MDLCRKMFKNFVTQYGEPDLDGFLDYIYYVMFTSYIKKTLIETRKNYFIKERKYKDKTMPIDTIETFYCDSGRPEEEANLSFDNEIEDIDFFKSIQELTAKQKTVLYNYYLNDKTEIEISEELRISKQAVNRIRKRALTSIKKIYKGGKS